MQNVWKITWIALLMCTLVSCNMFSSRVVSPPSASTQTDPVNLAQILSLSGKKFAKTDYEDIIHPNFIFMDYYIQSNTRTSFISRLNLIGSKYDSVSTTWDTTGVEINVGDTAMTVGRKYQVKIWKSGIETSDSGKVELDLLYYSVKNTWTITQWREQTSNSFFNPQYTN